VVGCVRINLLIYMSRMRGPDCTPMLSGTIATADRTRTQSTCTPCSFRSR
jgi:hypothetical protein